MTLDGLNLTEWQKEDVVDLLEDYPNLLEMSEEELLTLSRSLYWKAQGLYSEVTRIESDADTIKMLAIKKSKVPVKFIERGDLLPDDAPAGTVCIEEF